MNIKGHEYNKKNSEDYWNILIADDDKDVHEATLFILEDFTIFNRKLNFFHAYSASEAIDILSKHDDIAVILLDAIMEEEEAGLDAVETIRNELGLEDLRIIMRTGQPGQIPELETILRYDINDYKSKNELTRTKLVTALVAALRSWIQLRTLKKNRTGFEMILESGSCLFTKEGLLAFSEGVLTQMAGILDVPPEGIVCVSADADKKIVAASGKFQKMINRPIYDIGVNSIIESVLSAIDLEGTIHKNNTITLFFKDSQSMGFAVHIDSTKSLDPEKQRLLEQVCTTLSLYSGNVREMGQLKTQAWTDSLLPIPNLNALLEKTAEQMRRSSKEELLMILFDIVSFHRINNYFGFEYGNEVLRAFALFLKKRFDPSLFLARVSDDIFCIIGNRRDFDLEEVKEWGLIHIDMPRGRRELFLSLGGIVIRKKGSPVDELNRARRSLKQAKKERRFILHGTESSREEDRAEESYYISFLDSPFPDFCRLKYKVGEKGIEALPFLCHRDGGFLAPGKSLSLMKGAGRASSWYRWVVEKAQSDYNLLEQAGRSYPLLIIKIPGIRGIGRDESVKDDSLLVEDVCSDFSGEDFVDFDDLLGDS
ncbi:MAG: DUF3369 domain-containing protein [Spirochaetales bacterium]|nr:DUF3369 domain-containing protein [Spirochaetales bacterium]